MVERTLPRVTGREAEAGDMPLIAEALAAEGLPGPDRAGGTVFFVFREPGGGVIGFAGLLPTGAAALLRALVVLPPARARGEGSAIVAAMAETARQRGAEALYLMTEGAAPFFEKLGFARIARAAAPPDVAASPEFTTLCPASAVAMMRRLGPEAA